MPGYIKGILVALANTFVVALCLALAIADHDLVNAVFIICLMAFLPALFLGAILGTYAETRQTTNRRVVLTVMAAIACSTVAFLGIATGLSPFVLVSCIPTIASCSILERWTREPRDELPLARVA